MADPERPLLDDLAAGIHKPGFRNALGRQALMLAGVFLLGWSALEIAVFFLLEAWLFLSLRAAAEITLEPRFGVVATDPARFLWEFVKHWLVAAVFIGILVGGFGGFVVFPAFTEDAMHEFATEGIRNASLLVGLALLAGSIVFDTARFARRVAAGRKAEETAADDHGLRVALAKVACLAMASFWLGIAARVGLGPNIVAVGIAGAILYVEAVPERATRMFQPPKKSAA